MEPTPLVYGKYQLLERLAQGSLAEVWRARSHGVEGFEKVLVIKRLRHSLSDNVRFVELFIEEAKVAVMLTHANIAQVFDLGRTDGSYFIAAEYVRGPDLGRVLARCEELGRRVPTELAIYIVSELAKGLDYAHRRRNAELAPLGIVHRDVSPENVLLSFEGEVKLTDFGMARASEVVRPHEELPSGKLAYLAPEQRLGGAEIGARADVFALGVILFEALSGTRRREPSLVLPTDSLEVGDALKQLIERATASRPDDRHANAGELYEVLIEQLYESGRRISALDLSRWLEELGVVAATAPLDGPPSEVLPSAPLKEVFVEPVGPSPVTPPRGHPAQLEGPSLPPRPEWRDVSVLTLRGLSAADAASFAARFGGEPFGPQDEGALLVFGLAAVDGRDAHAAARCLLRLARARGRERLTSVLHGGRILLDGDGLASPDQARLLRAEASRWLGMAKVGDLLATPAACALLSDRFELSPELANGARAIERERRPTEGVSKFIGRRESLRAIGEVFASANRNQLRLLGVHGDAGTGKSRLIVEIERRLRHAGHDVGIYTAPCSMQTSAIPFFAIQELVRAVLGLEDFESAKHVAEQIDRLRLLGLPAQQRNAIAHLLGGPYTAEVPFEEGSPLERALLRIGYRLAQDKLTVFVWDGAEFMDAQSRALLLRLLAQRPIAARVIVLLAYRSEPEAFVKLPGFEHVSLGPLADEEVARLVRHRLGATEVHGELVREVNLKTGGNPLFVEELLVAMREHGTLAVEQGVARLITGGAQMELPRTLRGLVAARVGSLLPAHRSILQLAVTCGPRFSPELLAQAAGVDEATVRQALTHLTERGILREDGPGEYASAHDLVREVLYGALPLEERPALHAAVAQAIEALSPAAAVAERLAFHYREAGQWERAIAFLSQAATRYEGEHQLEAAIEAYTQVIDLLSRAEQPDRLRVLGLYARIGDLAYHTRTGEWLSDVLGQAIELAEQWGADEWLARLAMLRGRLLNKASRFREGRLWLERAQSVARRLEDRKLQRDIALAAADAHARNGEYKLVVPFASEALEASHQSGDVPSELRALLLLAPAFAALGDVVGARDALVRLEGLAAGHPSRLFQMELLRARALVQEATGDLAAAAESAREALELAREHSFPHETAVYAHHLGSLLLRADEEKRAFAALRLSYDAATEHGFARLQWRNVCLLGFLDALRFDSEQGYARMAQAVQYAEERGYVLDLVIGKYLLAIIAQKREEKARAKQLLHEVIELADPHGHVRRCEDAEAALRALEAGTPIALPR
ncbi:MAG TPA: protein kinase [Polyangiales bacterium]|nr:protein kinase [Polyangiales bacterium]